MGADEARVGFHVQALVLVLRGLRDSNWSRVCLEPPDLCDEKVDIRWIGPGGTLDQQVKHRTTPIGNGDVKKWLRELFHGSDAETRQVVFVGRLGSTVESASSECGVDFVCLSNSHENLRTEVAAELSVLAAGKVYLPVAQWECLADSVAVALDGISIGGASWTRAELVSLLRSQIEAARLRLIQEGGGWSLHSRRTLIARPSGKVLDFVRIELTNCRPKPETTAWSMEFSDSMSTRLLHVECGLPDAAWGVDFPETPSTPFLVDLWTNVEVEAGATVWFGLILQRDGWIHDSVDESMISEPFLPVDAAHEIELTVVVVGGAEWKKFPSRSKLTDSTLFVELNPGSSGERAVVSWRSLGGALSNAALDSVEIACRQVGCSRIPAGTIGPNSAEFGLGL